MHLYKYIDEPLKVLKEGFIRCTQVSALNDPYEAHISEEKLIALLSAEFDLFKGFKTELTKRRSNIGVISLSETYENPLMWSIYANHHKGAVIGFFTAYDNIFIQNSLYDGFRPFDLFTVNKPYRVRYRRHPRFHFDGLDHDLTNLHTDIVDGTVSELFLSKSFDWAHEQEHRYLIDLRKVDRVIAPQNAFTGQTLKFLKHLCSYKKQKNNYCFDLHLIDDTSNREAAGEILARYSKDPNFIYLMKLMPQCVSQLFLGANFTKKNIHIKPDLLSNQFRQSKAHIIPSSFNLNFDTDY